MRANARREDALAKLRQTPIDADPGLVRLEDEVGRFDTDYVAALVGLRWAILLAYISLPALGIVPMHPLAAAGSASWILITNVLSTWVWRQKRRVPWYDNTYIFADILSVAFAVVASANLDYPIWAAFLMVMATAAAELNTRLALINAIACTVAYGICAAVIGIAGWYDVRAAPLIVTGLIMGFIGANLAITFDGSRRLRAYIRQIAVTDSLTGLANRRKLSSFLGSPPRADRPIAVVVLDVDNFKTYNDTLGHLAGDQLLVRLAEALNHEFPDAHIVSRYGGDEFVLLVPTDAVDHAVRRATRLIEGGPYEPLPISVGIALWPDHEATLDGALAAADDCLRAAKTTNKGGVVALSHDRTQITNA
jgi:diguanylate cyclase (GGDEF)-like protein